MDYIKVNIKVNIAPNGDRNKVIIRRLESSTDRSNVNEIPMILNLLSYKTNMPSDVNIGFPYKFPFKLV